MSAPATSIGMQEKCHTVTKETHKEVAKRLILHVLWEVTNPATERNKLLG